MADVNRCRASAPTSDCRGSEHEVERAGPLVCPAVVADLPLSERGRWLVRLARLYREVVAAARAKDAVANSRRFRLLSTAWRVKLAMVRQVLIVHRYKDQNDPLLAPELEGRPSHRTLDGAGFRAPEDMERDRGGPEGALPIASLWEEHAASGDRAPRSSESATML